MVSSACCYCLVQVESFCLKDELSRLSDLSSCRIFFELLVTPLNALLRRRREAEFSRADVSTGFGLNELRLLLLAKDY